LSWSLEGLHQIVLCLSHYQLLKPDLERRKGGSMLTVFYEYENKFKWLWAVSGCVGGMSVYKLINKIDFLHQNLWHRNPLRKRLNLVFTSKQTPQTYFWSAGLSIIIYGSKLLVIWTIFNVTKDFYQILFPFSLILKRNRIKAFERMLIETWSLTTYSNSLYLNSSIS